MVASEASIAFPPEIAHNSRKGSDGHHVVLEVGVFVCLEIDVGGPVEERQSCQLAARYNFVQEVGLHCSKFVVHYCQSQISKVSPMDQSP